MALLTRSLLNRAFLDAMGPAVSAVVDPDARVLETELTLIPPRSDRVRVYLYNATNPPGGRSGHEHKIQLMVPGQGRNARGNFDRSGGYEPLLIGKVAGEDAFVVWDAGRYADFAFSANVQVNSDSVATAIASHSIVTWRRDTKSPPEEVLIAPGDLLADAVRQRLGSSSAPSAAAGATPPPAPSPSTPAGPAAPPAIPPSTSGRPSTPMPPTPAEVAGGGAPYVTATRTKHTEQSTVFVYDPDALDRGTGAHMALQNQLADTLRDLGVEPLSPAPGDPEFDLACRDGDMAYVIEVKSLIPTNEDKQLRLGLGQVLSYSFRIKQAWGVASVQPVLAVEYAPRDDHWPALCEEHGVILTWPDDFPGLF